MEDLEGDGKLVRTMRFSGVEEVEAGRADLERAIRAWCDARRAPDRRANGSPITWVNRGPGGDARAPTGETVPAW